MPWHSTPEKELRHPGSEALRPTLFVLSSGPALSSRAVSVGVGTLQKVAQPLASSVIDASDDDLVVPSIGADLGDVPNMRVIDPPIDRQHQVRHAIGILIGHVVEPEPGELPIRTEADLRTHHHLTRAQSSYPIMDCPEDRMALRLAVEVVIDLPHDFLLVHHCANFKDNVTASRDAHLTSRILPNVGA